MPKLKPPTSYTAGRTLTIGGTTYAPGATIPVNTVKGIKRLSALLGNRDIIPNADLHNRKGKLRTPTPTDIHATTRRAL